MINTPSAPIGRGQKGQSYLIPATILSLKVIRMNLAPNEPVNLELADTGFEPNHAFVGLVSFDARPWQKYRIHNGHKSRVGGTSPLFTFNYRKGFSGVAESEVTFDQVELGFRHTLDIGIRGKLDIALWAGKFLTADNLYFMDYKHFTGNLSPFVTTDPVGSFRLLDYYKYSTSNQYFSANAHYHFRKFLVTQFPLIRVTGITETLIIWQAPHRKTIPKWDTALMAFCGSSAWK